MPPGPRRRRGAGRELIRRRLRFVWVAGLLLFGCDESDGTVDTDVADAGPSCEAGWAATPGGECREIEERDAGPSCEAGWAATPGGECREIEERDAGPSCEAGWAATPGGDCQDIDECATDNGGCGDPEVFTCTNRAGEAPACACNEGTIGHGQVCIPVILRPIEVAPREIHQFTDRDDEDYFAAPATGFTIDDGAVPDVDPIDDYSKVGTRERFVYNEPRLEAAPAYEPNGERSGNRLVVSKRFCIDAENDVVAGKMTLRGHGLGFVRPLDNLDDTAELLALYGDSDGHGLGFARPVTDAEPQHEMLGLYTDGKASVRVNEHEWGDASTWVGLSNASHRSRRDLERMEAAGEDITGTLEIHPQEMQYGGIGGGFHTTRVSIDLKSLGITLLGGDRRCENVLELRFNGTDGITSSYRILDFDFFDEAGPPGEPCETASACEDGQSCLRLGSDEDRVCRNGTLTAGMLVDDDPDDWPKPSIDEPLSRRGRMLFYRRDLLRESPLQPKPIHAACGDCHAHDGRDLQYYAYPSASIESRALFHGLSENQSAAIAHYIRSLGDPDGMDVQPYGRPWNPPFQPGEGVDLEPNAAVRWAAGAGIDSVLEGEQDEDRLMAKQLFAGAESLTRARVVEWLTGFDLTAVEAKLPAPCEDAADCERGECQPVGAEGATLCVDPCDDAGSCADGFACDGGFCVLGVSADVGVNLANAVSLGPEAVEFLEELAGHVESDATAEEFDESRWGTINLREIPIALQLPDWNHWLPVVHPLDAFGGSDPPLQLTGSRRPYFNEDEFAEDQAKDSDEICPDEGPPEWPDCFSRSAFNARDRAGRRDYLDAAQGRPWLEFSYIYDEVGNQEDAEDASRGNRNRSPRPGGLLPFDRSDPWLNLWRSHTALRAIRPLLGVDGWQDIQMVDEGGTWRRLQPDEAETVQNAHSPASDECKAFASPDEDEGDDGGGAAQERVLGPGPDAPRVYRIREMIPLFTGEEIWKSARDYIQTGQVGKGSAFRTHFSPALALAHHNDVPKEVAKRSLVLWLMVKHWELVREHGLEARSADISTFGEPLEWPVRRAQTGHLPAPHIVASNESHFQSAGAYDQEEVVGLYESNAWYHLQMVLNSGARLAGTGKPVDWIYYYQHTHRLSELISALEEPEFERYREPLRYLATIVKGLQMRHNGLGPGSEGWRLRYVTPWRFLTSDREESYLSFGVPGLEGEADEGEAVSDNLLAHLPEFVPAAMVRGVPPLRASLAEAVVRLFTYKAQLYSVYRAREGPEDPLAWRMLQEEVDLAKDGCPDDCTKCPDYCGNKLWWCLPDLPGSDVSATDDLFRANVGLNHSDNFLRMGPLLRTLDVAQGVRDNFSAWQTHVWPPPPAECGNGRIDDEEGCDGGPGSGLVCGACSACLEARTKSVGSIEVVDIVATLAGERLVVDDGTTALTFELVADPADRVDPAYIAIELGDNRNKTAKAIGDQISANLRIDANQVRSQVTLTHRRVGSDTDILIGYVGDGLTVEGMAGGSGTACEVASPCANDEDCRSVSCLDNRCVE